MSKSNPKRFWTFFRNKTKSKSLPCKIQNDSAGSADPQSKACLFNDYFKSVFKQVDEREQVPGMTGPPNSFTARGPVTLTAILFPQPAVSKRHSRRLTKNSDAMKLTQIFQVPTKTRPFSAGVNF